MLISWMGYRLDTVSTPAQVENCGLGINDDGQGIAKQARNQSVRRFALGSVCHFYSYFCQFRTSMCYLKDPELRCGLDGTEAMIQDGKYFLNSEG